MWLAAGDVGRTVGDEEDRGEDGTGEKRDEVAVVSLAHAVVDPDAVVIVGQDAGSASGAMRRPWRPPDPTGRAVLDLDFAEWVAGSLRCRQTDAVVVLLWNLEMVLQLCQVHVLRQHTSVAGGSPDEGGKGHRPEIVE